MKKQTGFYIAMGVIAAAAAYGLKKIYDAEEKARKEFIDHKAEKLAEKNISQDIEEASVKNHNFDINEKFEAKKILLSKAEVVTEANTIEKFDKAVDDLYSVMQQFTGEQDAAKVELKILKEKVIEEKERQKRQEERDAELERTRVFARSVTASANTIASGLRTCKQVYNFTIGENHNRRE